MHHSTGEKILCLLQPWYRACSLTDETEQSRALTGGLANMIGVCKWYCLYLVRERDGLLVGLLVRLLCLVRPGSVTVTGGKVGRTVAVASGSTFGMKCVGSGV